MSPEQQSSFGRRLRQLREVGGLTQEELAGRAGLTPNAISDLERDRRRRPYPHTVRSLADALSLSEDERAALVSAVPGRSAPTATLEVLLPAPPTPLLGRERELGEVGDLLRRPEVRMLTLTGMGGVGKTRLALEAARDAADLFPDGVAFVALEPLNNAELVVPTVARSLGLRESGGQTSHEALCDFIRDKRLLLVLDNFEHLLEAASEISRLIEACPGPTVLATSRAPLHIRGEQEYPVPPLRLPASTRSPARDEVVNSPSGHLFVERARAASPSFELDERNAAAVASICWHLAGLPLALELAAAKTRYLDPTTLLSRLDRALSVGRERDLPDRQRTMRATLDWSHDLLSGPEQALFRRLSAFTGGFSLEAAEAVGAGEEEVGSEDVLELLGDLVEQSLVTAAKDARYGMLEPVRQYARERLEESGEAEKIWWRHAAFFLKLAERGAPELTRSDQAAWLERLGREHDNLRAALSWLLQRGDAERAAHLGWDLKWFWYIRGHLAEGTRWMERALAHEDALTLTGRAKALTVIAGLVYSQGDLHRHAAFAEEGARLAREIEDRELLAMATYLGGHAAFVRGDLARAAALMGESETLYRTLGDEPGTGLALTVLGQIALAGGDAARAERLFDESEELLRVSGSWWNLTTNRSIRAITTEVQGDDAQTIALLQESLALALRLRDTQNAAYGLEGLAGALAMMGQGPRAARLFGAAVTLRDWTGSAIGFATLHELYERRLETLRAQLDAKTFEAAWSEGRAMSPQQAVEYALEGDEASSA